MYDSLGEHNRWVVNQVHKSNPGLKSIESTNTKSKTSNIPGTKLGLDEMNHVTFFHH